MQYVYTLQFRSTKVKERKAIHVRMQVILDSLFARPGSAPIGGGKKGEFRDWTTCTYVPQLGSNNSYRI